MYWEEKLHFIKQKYLAPIFKDMFREGRIIEEKIIRTFHKATCLTFKEENNYECLLKKINSSEDISILEFEKSFWGNFEDGNNYWLYVIDMPMGSSYRVYDCQKLPIISIYFSISVLERARFYIVDKKYKWLYYIDVKKLESTASIFYSTHSNE